MIISPKDLRIDNLLYQKNTALVAKVSSISKSGFSCTDEFGVAIKNGLFEPIPITEQWLIRLGFEYNKHYFACYSLGDFYIDKDDYILQDIDMTVKFQYVHELQNAVHALTKKELL